MEYKQIPLSQIPQGLCEDIAMIKQEPLYFIMSKLINFENYEEEGLGPTKMAIIEKDNQVFGIRKHDYHQVDGSLLVSFENKTPAENKSSLESILDIMELKKDDLIWVKPNIIEQGYEFQNKSDEEYLKQD